VAWQLDIHTFDIGVGSSGMIIASDPAVPGRTRSILIDGGLAAAAHIVHQNVLRVLGGAAPSTILVTHNDIDHSAGIANLLQADNLSMLSRTVATIAAPYGVITAPAGTTSAVQAAARVAAAVTGVMRGGWGVNAAAVGPMVLPLGAAINLAGLTVAQAAEAGFNAAEAYGPLPGATLEVRRAFRKRAAIAAGTAAAAVYAAATTAAMTQTAIEVPMFNAMLTSVPTGARFWTNCLYATCRIVDNGPQFNTNPVFVQAANGATTKTPFGLAVPGINRPRTGVPPAMGTELFWNNAAPAPNGPVAVVISGATPAMALPTGRVWQGPATNPMLIAGGDPTNTISIGLVIRFNGFMYYTAGDLPSNGEDLLWPRLRTQQLPSSTGVGALLPVPVAPLAPPPPVPLVPALSASHHGSDTSTSLVMVNAIYPRTVAISVGAKHNHPDQPVINRLFAAASVQRYYLTNCRYPRVGIPLAPVAALGPPPAVGAGLTQPVGGNKSRIAGDNNPNNGLAGRARGDIHLQLTQVNSQAAAGVRNYSVTYWENYPPPLTAPGPRTETFTW
jgi:hypothetical protein